MNLTGFLLTSQTSVHGVFGERGNREVGTLWGLSGS